MILRPLLPTPDAVIDTEAPDARGALMRWYTPPAGPWVRLNVIASVDGSARDGSGTSRGLTNRADRAVLGAIRATSDTVLVGAATMRAEPSLTPKSAHLTILTRGGDFTGAAVRPDIVPGRILVVGPANAESTARRTFAAPFDFLALADVAGSIPVERVIRTLRDSGRQHVVCEGGPELAGQLLDAGLVDEICLSTSPVLLGGGFPVFGAMPRPALPVDLTALLADDAGGLYARWRVVRD